MPVSREKEESSWGGRGSPRILSLKAAGKGLPNVNLKSRETKPGGNIGGIASVAFQGEHPSKGAEQITSHI